MDRTLIIDCNKKIAEEVKIYGFIQTKRDHGKISFLDLADRSASIQVVIIPDKVECDVNNLHPQDALCIIGVINKRPEKLINKNIATGEIEILAKNIQVLSKAQELPFDMGGKELDLQLPTLLDFRSLTLR